LKAISSFKLRLHTHLGVDKERKYIKKEERIFCLLEMKRKYETNAGVISSTISNYILERLPSPAIALTIQPLLHLPSQALIHSIKSTARNGIK
jgi:hypothetical protein